jgi:hypothetical protein
MATPFLNLFCTDEDVAIKAPGDYPGLVPSHQRAAFGTGASLADWILTATEDLEAIGLSPGHVVRLTRTTQDALADLVGVVSVTGMAATLCRLGELDETTGPAPVFPDGASITYDARTVRPQIVQVTRDMLVRYGYIDFSYVADPGTFRRLCVLNVLIDLFGSQHRAAKAGTSPEEDFRVKYGDLLAERDMELKRIDALHSPATEQPSRRPALGPMVTPSTWRVPPNY